ncbi:MFS transporter [Novosphingobium sp. ZN18A2]|uniref:MFS transporter n=1 Tax=Novosphingobium sp. ZN18A2 TaxID=3079861 RepID=UPI0030CCF643
MAEAAIEEQGGPPGLNNVEKLSGQSLSAGMIGNVLEWYDFGLYGYLAPMIGALFFPSANPIASLIGAYGGFAIGFAVRPIGGAVLGHLGDRIGRQTVLVASVVLMGGATTLIGFLPTYDQIGIWAPILLLLIRLFQGFSVGGEFTGSVTYLVETAPMHRRGFAGSFANIGSTAGYLLAAALAAGTVMLTKAHPEYPWIWRVPFIAGGLLAVLAYWMRARLTHTGFEPDIPEEGEEHELPMKQAFTQAPRAMILAVIFTWGYGVADYLALVFLPTYASSFGAVDHGAALTINTFSQAAAIIVIPLAGWLTDHALRRRSMLILAFALIFFTSVTVFELAAGPGLMRFAVAQVAFAVFLGMIMGTAPAMLAELFPSHFRMTGYSIAFNIGLGFGGGTAPLIATALIDLTGHNLAAAGYMMVGALMSVVALALMKDRSRQPLH